MNFFLTFSEEKRSAFSAQIIISLYTSLSSKYEAVTEIWSTQVQILDNLKPVSGSSESTHVSQFAHIAVPKLEDINCSK